MGRWDRMKKGGRWHAAKAAASLRRRVSTARPDPSSRGRRPWRAAVRRRGARPRMSWSRRSSTLPGWRLMPYLQNASTASPSGSRRRGSPGSRARRAGARACRRPRGLGGRSTIPVSASVGVPAAAASAAMSRSSTASCTAGGRRWPAAPSCRRSHPVLAVPKDPFALGPVRRAAELVRRYADPWRYGRCCPGVEPGLRGRGPGAVVLGLW